jgi:hypothetical protein
MVSTLSLLSEPSTVSLMYCGRLFRPTGWGSFSESIWNPNLVAITTLVTQGSESLAHEPFIHERTVDFSGIEESDAAFDR